MRWLDPDLTADAWDRRVAAYAAHLVALGDRLPDSVRALAQDPRFDLHDAHIVDMTADLARQIVTMVVEAGDVQVGYRRLSLVFEEAAIVPGNLQLLAYAVGAEFRSNHWNSGRSATVIRYQEVDVVDGHRYVLRLRLWPFHEFGVEFATISATEMPSDRTRQLRGGRFSLIHADTRLTHRSPRDIAER